MSSLTDDWACACGAPSVRAEFGSGTAGRFYRAGGLSAGGDVDGVILSDGSNVRCACPGQIALVESGGSFSSGASLETDSVGRAVLHSTGTVVARALESAGASGVLATVCFSSGR